MSRQEFGTKVRKAAWERCKGLCEACGSDLGHKKKAFDHIKPDGLGGKPTLSNCAVLCFPCHNDKTVNEDRPIMQKADNQRQADQGLKAPPRQQIRSRGFQKSAPKDAPKTDRIGLPPRRVDAFGRRIGG
jgi:5-methylcytosine-specific restriction enzyme A